MSIVLTYGLVDDVVDPLSLNIDRFRHLNIISQTSKNPHPHIFSNIKISSFLLRLIRLRIQHQEWHLLLFLFFLERFLKQSIFKRALSYSMGMLLFTQDLFLLAFTRLDSMELPAHVSKGLFHC